MFCTQCGSKLADAAKFCSACGASISANNVEQPIAILQPESVIEANATKSQLDPVVERQATSSVVVEMESQPFFIFKIGKLLVLIDDQVVTNDLWFGKTMDFTINGVGQHTIQIALKSVITRRSEKISFQISPGQTIKFDGIYSNVSGGVSLVQI